MKEGIKVNQYIQWEHSHSLQEFIYRIKMWGFKQAPNCDLFFSINILELDLPRMYQLIGILFDAQNYYFSIKDDGRLITIEIEKDL